MARSRKVDRKEAVAAALAVFSETGFAGIGTRELEDRTGISRFLLQTDYGGKKTLYLAALDLYLDQFDAWLTTVLHDGGLQALALFFRSRADTSVMTDHGRFGCFMLTTATEFKTSDHDVNRRTQRYFNMFTRNFTACLTSARQSGQVKSDVDIDKGVAVLSAGIFGMNVFIRAQGDNAVAAHMGEGFATQIEAWMA